MASISGAGSRLPYISLVALISASLSLMAAAHAEKKIDSISYPIVDTAQVQFFDDKDVIPKPKPGDDFFGQDAQYSFNKMNYSLAKDGLTVVDNVTGLMWTQSPDLNRDGEVTPDDKIAFRDVGEYVEKLNQARFGGYSDWRLPTIKQLYSLMNFSGIDPAGPSESNAKPFIDTRYFAFAYGDEERGERTIDAQFWSSNIYTGDVFRGSLAVFGLNLADGRIKAYAIPGGGPRNYAYFVRGNQAYGKNKFVDNKDGTVSDLATGLMWMKSDSRKGMNWQEALAWAEEKNAQNFLGHSDWRLPNAKELQSIVDYQRSPNKTTSASIDSIFEISSIKNESKEKDFPWFWTSTTHVNSRKAGASANYISFGRAMGYMAEKWVDLHGAGAQRSDPKSGQLDEVAVYKDGGYHIKGLGRPQSDGDGPQRRPPMPEPPFMTDGNMQRAMGPPPGGAPEDAIRIDNYVRLVRNIDG
ncbi:DUF1566 domain-containing protein [Microbulbifer sp. JMSA004]|uniref:Lcl C-terminal domain-containing protein n=1 Tax=unclassified Microbulbifer TaxID=2619833 RepID=UPI0024ADB02E|nr:DUF1566 domain-containing protein [Microbulbifer sp. VAAF005]WHI45275.1 DUF1566 domain-containing protein [Microbulbifer sp. VAAF005]